jgi:hypothetical protein
MKIMEFLGLELPPITYFPEIDKENIFGSNIVPKEQVARPIKPKSFVKRPKTCFLCGEHASHSPQNRLFAVKVENNLHAHTKYSCHHRCLKKYYKGGKYLCLEWPNRTLLHVTVESRNWEIRLSTKAATNFKLVKVPETAINLLL